MSEAPEYYVPSGFGEAEFIEKRSRFIGRVWPVETEEVALGHLKEMREKHWDAAHNVYAYILRDCGTMRYSDDGEPQGTSGMPVLGVFRAAGINNFCCVVTRYFGGVLLGTGGLVRAYSHTAALALDAAGVSAMRLWENTEIICSYPLFERVRNELIAISSTISDISYESDVTIKVLIPKEQTDKFSLKLNDLTSGTAILKQKGEEYRTMRIK
jgi:uncharacterized YigZ family protein